MDKATDDILDKIRKLMALGASPSEAEAASALAKARTLLARHGLSLADVETRTEDISEDVLLEKKRLRPWEAHLIQVIAECTFTQALHVRRGECAQVLLIGREINTRSAVNLFAYLHLTLLKLGRAHSGRVAHLESFRRGAVERIGERLAALEKEAGPKEGEQKEAEVEDRQLTIRMSATASRENAAFVENKYGKLKKKRVGRRVDADSYYRGRDAGEGVSLHRQID